METFSLLSGPVDVETEVLTARELMEQDRMLSDNEFLVAPRRGSDPVVINLDEVEQLAAIGTSLETICDYYGISAAKLARSRKKFDALDAAVRKGQAKGCIVVSKKVMEQIQKGNVILPMFYLKAKGGWSDQPNSKQETGRQTNVHLYLPNNNRQ